MKAEASAELEDASAAYRATDARVTAERAVLAEELAEAKQECAVPFLMKPSVQFIFDYVRCKPR